VLLRTVESKYRDVAVPLHQEFWHRVIVG
jgi:hypothetical protein